MALPTQTLADKAGYSVAGKEDSDGLIYYLLGNVRHYVASGSPDGEVTAPVGSRFFDKTGVCWYENIDAATAWREVSPGPYALLAATPTAPGIKVDVNGKKYISAYNGTGSATVVGEPVMLCAGDDAGEYVQALAAATTAIPVLIGVALAITNDGTLGWYQYEGEAEVHMTATAGMGIEVLNTATTAIDAGADFANRFGCAIDTAAGAVATAYLFGQQVQIAAA